VGGVVVDDQVDLKALGDLAVDRAQTSRTPRGGGAAGTLVALFDEGDVSNPWVVSVMDAIAVDDDATTRLYGLLVTYRSVVGGRIIGSDRGRVSGEGGDDGNIRSAKDGRIRRL